MFNIGGQGQYLVGLYVANWLGYDLAGMRPLPHILIAVGGATLAGAAWAGIAGFLKATVGAHEVISTIMLNWIAIWVGIWLFGDGGPLQNAANKSVPISNDVAASAQLPVFWGVQGLQGLDVAFFVALAALVVFALILNRTTLGYEVRAVGFNPEAAAYGGISVKKNLIRAMAISGAFAGLAGALDMLGYLYHFGDVRHPGQLRRLPRHRGRAARAEHRRRHRVRGAGLRGAPVRDDARPVVERHRPVARRQPHLHDPGARGAVRRRRRADPLRLERAPEAPAEGEVERPRPRHDLGRPGQPAEPRQRAGCGTPPPPATPGSRSACFAAFLGIPPIQARTATWSVVIVGSSRSCSASRPFSRGRGRLGLGAVAVGVLGIGLGVLATRRASGT